MSEKTITQQAYDKAVEAMGTAGKALKGQYENVRGYIDINNDGSITFKDTEIAGSTLADNVKAGLGTLKAELSDKASQVYKAAFGDGKEDEGLWGAFKKNPINMVMAGVGALLAGLLFAESGMIGLIIAAVVGAVAFGGLSTYLTQPHEDPHASPSPAGTNQPAAGTEPAQQQSQGAGVDFLKILSDSDKVITAKEYNDTFKPTDAGKLPEGYVLLTPKADSKGNPGDVLIYAKEQVNGDQVTYSDVQVMRADKTYVQLKDTFTGKTTEKDQIANGILANSIKPEHTAIDPSKDASLRIDDIQAPIFAAVEATQKAASGVGK